MKVTQEKLPDSRLSLEIEIPPEVSQQAYDRALQRFLRSANIPGFRKGKVPRQVLIQRFGTSQIKAAVIEELVEDSLKQALEQEKIQAIGNYQLRSSFEELIQQFEPGSVLTFSAAVDVPPEATVESYKGLQVQAEEVKYDPSRVETLLEGYQNRLATLVPVEDRAAQEGDTAIVDFVGRLKPEPGSDDEPEEFPGGSASDFQIELLPGRFIEGFIEGMIGMAIDETREIDATFPDSYPQPDLADKPVVFTVTLKDLKHKELPELDDDFAQEVSEFETIAELRTSLEERYQKEAEASTQANKERALLDELVKYVEVELPETLIRQELDEMITQTAIEFANRGVDVKQMFTREIVQRLREQSRPEAINRLKRSLAIAEIAKQESLAADAEAIENRVKEFLAENEGQKVDEAKLRSLVEDDLLKEKVIGFLEENGTVELVPEGTLKPEEDDSEATEAVEVEVLDSTADIPDEAVAEDTEAIVTEVTEVPDTDDLDAEDSSAKSSGSKSKKGSKSQK